MSSAIVLLSEHLENQRQKLEALVESHSPLLERAEAARSEISAQEAHVHDLERSLQVLEDVELSVADKAADESAREAGDPDAWVDRNRVALAEEVSKPWRPRETVDLRGLDVRMTVSGPNLSPSDRARLESDLGARRVQPGDPGYRGLTLPSGARPEPRSKGPGIDLTKIVFLPIGQVDSLEESRHEPSKLTLIVTPTAIALIRAGYAVCVTPKGDLYDARGIPPQPTPAPANSAVHDEWPDVYDV